MVWLKIGPQNGATIVTRMTNVAILKYLEMTWNDTLILSHCHLHPFIVSAISQQLIHSPWSLCAEGTEEPHLDPGCYPAMCDQVGARFPCYESSIHKRQNDSQEMHHPTFSIVFCSHWVCRFFETGPNAYVACSKKMQTSMCSESLDNLQYLRHSSTTSLTLSHLITYMFLHVSPLDRLWPWFWRGLEVLPLPLHGPVKLNRDNKLNKNYIQIHNKLNLSIVESVHLSEVLVSLILIDTFCFSKLSYAACADVHCKPPVLVASHLAIPVSASPQGQWTTISNVLYHTTWQLATYHNILTWKDCMILSNQNDHETIKHACHPLPSLTELEWPSVEPLASMEGLELLAEAECTPQESHRDQLKCIKHLFGHPTRNYRVPNNQWGIHSKFKLHKTAKFFLPLPLFKVILFGWTQD